MKKLQKAISLLLAMACLAGLMLSLAGCNSKEDVFKITVDSENGEKTYSVSYDLYRTVFVYLRNRVPDVVQDEEGNQSLASNAEKNKAIKEVAEQTLVEFYGLVAFAADNGITITEEDKAQFRAEHRDKLQGFIDAIDDADFNYKGTKEEYAEMIYERTMLLAGTTPEYYEFEYYRSLLTKRLKLLFGGNLEEYLDQSYRHYKQVIITYPKGDAAAEADARNKIEEAYAKLLGGASMDSVILEYGNGGYQSDIYFDAYAQIVGSTSNETVTTVILNAVQALDIGEYSEIMTGDESDRLAYFAIYRRSGFDIDFICSDYTTAEALYEHPYAGATSLSPHFSRYSLLLESYVQNTSITPYDVKAYNKINIKNID